MIGVSLMSEHMMLAQIAASAVAGIGMAVVFCAVYAIALVIEGRRRK